MVVLLYLLLIGGLLISMSQASYAYVIAKVDVSTAERRVHCLHHAVHSVCGLLTVLTAIALLKGGLQHVVVATCASACGILLLDALTFLICNKIKNFDIRRDAIRHKWAGEKVFGPEHDREVSVYRTLKEITEKTLLRDAVHAALFALLFLISLG